MSQMESWLTDGDVQRLALVVSGIDSGETLERWQFNVSVDEAEGKDGGGSVEIAKAGNDENNMSYNVMKKGSGADDAATSKKMGKKTVKEVHDEIQAIIRQITASVTFLPLLNEPCSFDLLIYTNKTAVVPKKWADSDPCYIMNSQEVKLRSFTTSVSPSFPLFFPLFCHDLSALTMFNCCHFPSLVPQS